MPSGIYPRPTLEERFWRKVKRDSSDCWEWTGTKDRCGYGIFCVSYHKRIQAHRYSLMLTGHVISQEFEVDHLCRNPACVNPKHLEVVTHQENAARGNAGQRFAEVQRAKTHCPYGHPYDLFNTYFRHDGGRGCKRCRRLAITKYNEHRREVSIAKIHSEGSQA